MTQANFALITIGLAIPHHCGARQLGGEVVWHASTAKFGSHSRDSGDRLCHRAALFPFLGKDRCETRRRERRAHCRRHAHRHQLAGERPHQRLETFSPLKQINDANVGNLGLAWYLDYDGAMGVVSEPIVVDGVIYVSAPLSKVYAVDAVSGKLLWKFDPKIRLDQALNGSYSARTNGGVAVWNGKVYVGTGDCRLIAYSQITQTS